MDTKTGLTLKVIPLACSIGHRFLQGRARNGLTLRAREGHRAHGGGLAEHRPRG